jgi:hypothetical protein
MPNARRSGDEVKHVRRGERNVAARKYLASKMTPRRSRPTSYVAINCLLLTKAEGTPKKRRSASARDVDAYLAALKDTLEAQIPLPPERTRLLSRYDVAAWRRLASTHRARFDTWSIARPKICS